MGISLLSFSGDHIDVLQIDTVKFGCRSLLYIGNQCGDWTIDLFWMNLK